MKRSQALAVFILALMLLSALPLQQAQSATPYTEKLSVYIAGGDALWYMRFGGLNSSAKLTAFESTPGLSWYNVTAFKTTSWDPDFQVFGPSGYNLLPIPYRPSEGLVLTLGSDSQNDANAAAAALDSFLLSAFVPANVTGLAPGTYSFVSPVSFSDVVPSTLLSFLPTHEGGFVNAITPSTFDTTFSPMVILGGTKSGGAFDHSLVVGSMTNAGLDESSRPNYLKYFGSSIALLQASQHSTGTVISIKFLDGMINSSDTKAVTSSSPQFSSSYYLTLNAGKKIGNINATVLEQPLQLLATRSVTTGVLRAGDNLSVTLTLTNLMPSTAITKVGFSDSWWNGTGLFKLASGSSKVAPTTIGGGSSITPVYVLRYTGTVTERLTIPPTAVKYTYMLGGKSFQGTATLNPVTLSLGADDAVVYATLQPTGGFDHPVGTSQTFNVVVNNVGTLPASSVVVAGHPVSGLAAKTGTATVAVTQGSTGLLGINFQNSYTVTYQNPNGNHLNASTNRLSLVFSHYNMKIGLPSIVMSADMSNLPGNGVNLTLSYVTTNHGSANLTTFVASATLPAGLGCGKAVGKGISCSGGKLSISYNQVNPTQSLKDYMKINVTSPVNYLIPALAFSGTTKVFNFTGVSNSLDVPTGLVLGKSFSPDQLFAGMGSTVTVTAVNNGPFAFYNTTISTTGDNFYSLTSSSPTSKTLHSVQAGASLNFSFSIKAESSFGTLTSAAVASRLFFGGTLFTTHVNGPQLSIYEPLRASITTSPSMPIEGRNFTITISITNPSAVPVSSVLFTLQVPSGLSLSRLNNMAVSGGVITVQAASLGPQSSVSASASAIATSGITVPFKNAKLTYSYSGSTVNGGIPANGIAIGEDTLTRYILPTGLAIFAVLAAAFYLRRKGIASVPASQQ